MFMKHIYYSCHIVLCSRIQCRLIQISDIYFIETHMQTYFNAKLIVTVKKNLLVKRRGKSNFKTLKKLKTILVIRIAFLFQDPL